MIELNNVCFTYANSSTGALNYVSLNITDGECVLLCGRSGCGKTTITRLINGLIPHYYEGELEGKVSVNGIDTMEAELYETARCVGSVFQNPRSQFFCVDTTSEIAFGCENAGLPEPEILERIRNAAEEIYITDLLGRSIFELSGGEKQKVACASVSAQKPEVFVLDEPTSNLDTDSIEELKKTLLLWKSQGKTIIIAEHRLYWLKEICDRVIYLENGEVTFDMPMQEFKLLSTERISELGLRMLTPEMLKSQTNDAQSSDELVLQNFSFFYDKFSALSIPRLTLPRGGVIAVIRHNGAGKSTFSRCLCGLEKRFHGNVFMNNKKYNRRGMLRKCYMVMQDVNHQLFCESVQDEVMLGMNEDNADKIDKTLSDLDLNAFTERHPMSLSGGQKQRVVVASAILADKEILIFDEPTSGLDFHNMEQTADLISSLRGEKTVFIVTHDPELIVRCCTHILHLEDGKVAENYPLNSENTAKLTDFFVKRECECG